MKPSESTQHQFLTNFTNWPQDFERKKKEWFSSSFADLLFFLNPYGGIWDAQILKLVHKNPFKKMRMIQGTQRKKNIQPFGCPQHLQIYTNNKNNFNKSQINNIIHQKEKFFVNQVSYKFKYPLFTKKNPNLFRKKIKIKIKLSSTPLPSFLTCNWLLASTTSRFATPNHHLSRSLTQLQASTGVWFVFSNNHF